MINFIYGIFISGGLIMAIGAQNVHVIKYGLSGRNVFFVSLTCFLCDFILMTCGVFFVGSVSALNKWVNALICVFAILFLLFYAYASFKSALIKKNLDELSFEPFAYDEPLSKSVLATLAITLLNPHVYLDTVVIVGGYASSLSIYEKLFFISGALLSSCVWFFSLGYLSKHLRKLFKSKKTWVIFDFSIAFFMFVLALNLSYYLLYKVF